MEEIIGRCEEDLVKNKPSSNLTNWFADALLDGTQKLVNDTIDFAIQNYGGLRIPILSKGDVTVGEIYELMPFDNTIYVLKLDGFQIQQLLDHIAAAGGWPISKTVRFDIAYGHAKNVTIKGRNLDTLKLYQVAIPDYLANGGDNLVFLKDIQALQTGKLIRDIIISEVRLLSAHGLPIPSLNDQRIKD
jgi:2',3'-cyclic-nucleotide 2'-phosphodiesterase (5'-nucleotidase family)